MKFCPSRILHIQIINKKKVTSLFYLTKSYLTFTAANFISFQSIYSFLNIVIYLLNSQQQNKQATSRWLNGEVEWAERPASASATTQKTPAENGTWRSASTLGWHESSRAREPRRSESSVEGSSGLTWLQRQQQKLRERKEARERVARLPLEWDTASSRQVRRSASHR